MIPLISVIILAAGESRRMGEPKQLMPLGKTTILERTVDNFLNSEVHNVIVVVGYRAEEVISLIADRSVTIAVNSAYREGMSTSIVAGLSLISDKTQGVMLALADCPGNKLRREAGACVHSRHTNEASIQPEIFAD